MNSTLQVPEALSVDRLHLAPDDLLLLRGPCAQIQAMTDFARDLMQHLKLQGHYNPIVLLPDSFQLTVETRQAVKEVLEQLA